jgi:Resolvase, N terminal domain
MIYGYARVSTDGQSVAAQVVELREVGCAKIFTETASGARTDRTQLSDRKDREPDTSAVRGMDSGVGFRGHRYRGNTTRYPK